MEKRQILGKNVYMLENQEEESHSVMQAALERKSGLAGTLETAVIHRPHLSGQQWARFQHRLFGMPWPSRVHFPRAVWAKPKKSAVMRS